MTTAQYAELGFLCFAALAGGRLSTPARIVKVAEAKGFDLGDKVLLPSLNDAMVSSMQRMEKRRKTRWLRTAVT